MSTESDVFPIVSVDRSYGELVGDIDIDLASIADHLKSKGLSDIDIRELSIVFTGVNALAQGENGSFNKIQKRIALHQREVNEDVDMNVTKTLVHELEHYAALFDDEFVHEVQDFKRSMAVEMVNRHENGAMGSLLEKVQKGLHETAEFGLSFSHPRQVEASWKTLPRDLVSLGVLALSELGVTVSGVIINSRLKAIHKKMDVHIYKNNPDEIRARQAAADYTGPLLVTFKQKSR